jgi:hypothetical protein
MAMPQAHVRSGHTVVWIDEENHEWVHVADYAGRIIVVHRCEMETYNRGTMLVFRRWRREERDHEHVWEVVDHSYPPHRARAACCVGSGEKAR